ncbi:NADPH oxidase 5 [Poecile atricapillus]|uniref:NADPH oxidase 5 n=1 Tax=Poecile atricapillus TaxID=48891 RepID=UPI002739430D|nr:NADPH oxidase 5 [Poecile atricapillus]
MAADADAEWLRWASERFGNGAGKEPEIGLEEFTRTLGIKESFFAERFFALFDSDGSGSLSREELLGSLRRLLSGNSTEKLRFLFQVYDVDGSGSIDGQELLQVLRGCLRESSLALPEERLRALSQALLRACDRDRSGSISFPELREQLEAFPELLESLSISAASWLKPPSPAERRLCCFSWESCREQRAGMRRFSRECWGPGGFSRECWLAGMRRVSRECRWPGLWLAGSALLLALGALRYRERGPGTALARGCGAALNLNCALLPALMLRRSVSRLRSCPLWERLPLERHERGHARVGHLVLALGSAHAAAHLGARLERAGGPFSAAVAELLRPGPGSGGVAGTAPLTGLALLPLLLAMLLGSSPCLRRRGHFQVFYWTHLSYIPVWFLLLLHAPHFWKWFLIPGSLFFLEKVLGWLWRRAGDLHILEARLLPSKVTHLVIQRPESFRFQPGDFVFLNIPAIAAYEWHPFSISSAPEQPGTLWLHIRARGQWTNKLYEHFQRLESHGPEPDLPGKSRRERREQVGSRGSHGIIPTPRSCSIKCFLDGPYGSPSRRIFTSEHAVLIGAGIGITPFASILQSIMFRYRRRMRSCPSCRFSWREEERDEEMTLRKVDFVWITRDQQHLQWFLSLLAQLEAQQAELEPGGKFLELHLFMTSALGKGDVKALGLQLALDLLAAQEQRDSISGLRSRTQPGHPDWDKLFGKVAAERRGKVRVFFCGSAGLARIIRGHCRSFGFAFSKENF